MILLALGLLGCPAVRAVESGPFFSPTELAGLDRENAMWRLVRVEEDVEANVRLWRNRGFTEKEVDLLKQQLAEIWKVELERNYGWLSKEAIERIKTVDQSFTIRLRAIRLNEQLGIRSAGYQPETMASLGRDWKRALQRELDYHEITEFRLMNSKSAQVVAKLGEGLDFSTDELRTLCTWQREFDEQHSRETKCRGFPKSQDTWKTVWTIGPKSVHCWATGVLPCTWRALTWNSTA